MCFFHCLCGLFHGDQVSSHGPINIQQMREMIKIITVENKLNCFAAL